jgi:DNA polymerase III sliding clamp (beta) subunit (PCNA family)
MRIEKKSLARAQRVLKTVVMPRPYRPVLGSVLILDGYAYATDLENTVRVALNPGAREDPPFLVPWVTFKALKGDTEIAPVLGSETPKVRVMGATVASFALEEYPPVPEYTGSLRPLHDLNRLLLHLRRCDVVRAKEKMARALLTGIGVSEDGTIVATDGFSVYLSDADAEGQALAAAAGGHGVLPGVAASILSAFGWSEAAVGAATKLVEQDSYAGGKHTKIATMQTNWYFTSHGEGAWLRGLEGKYLPIRDMLPRKFPHAVTVNRRDLLAAVEQAGMVATEEPYPVALQADGALRVYAKQDDNEYDRTLRAQVTGAPLTVYFHARRLSAVLGKAADGEEAVTIEFSSTEGAARIRLQEGTLAQMPLVMDDRAPLPPRQVPA